MASDAQHSPAAVPAPAIRRRLVVAALPLVLAACGWHPVYAPAAAGGDGAAADLAAIQVGLIGERNGQLLRNALQERFERAGIAAAKRYDLTVSYSVASESLGIQQDLSVTRLRYVGKATFTLTTDRPTRTTLIKGAARVVDGMNEFDQQYFAADQEAETVQRRIAEAVADQIALQLAVFFRKRAAGGNS